MFDFDGFMDMFGLSLDGTGSEEGALPSDLGAEGVPVDLDGDGIADMLVYQQLQDLDGDGTPDQLVTEQYLDTDGNGVYDTLQVDIAQDTDGDGLFDVHTLITGQDRNEDGVMDSFVTEQALDTDGDGLFDTVQTEIERDTDGDGVMDFHSIAISEDLDGDGVMDYMQVAEDFDNDGVFDSVRQYVDVDGDGIWDPADQDLLEGNASAYEAFDPDRADPDSIVGDPAEAMEHWHAQEPGMGSCAVVSQEFVLEQLTGQEFHEDELCRLAEEQGWYGPGGGTALDDVGNLLEYMGLQVEKGDGRTMEDVERCLENGGQVIVGVDCSELWTGTSDDGFFAPGMGANHAIQVIGIDHSDPDNPMVIINDSGVQNGCGAMVPVDVFVDAWEDSGCFMVEAYAE